MNTFARPEKNIVVVTGPAGSGKDTLIDAALQALPFEQVITTTSRPMRENEKEGREYFFLSPEEFIARIQNQEFAEYSQNENGAYYGVEIAHLNAVFAYQKKIIWKVDWKGVQNLKKLYPGIKSVAIMASRETLAARLHSREGSLYTQEYFQERAKYAEDYFNHVKDYDYIIWNEDGELTESIEKFKQLLTEITSD